MKAVNFSVPGAIGDPANAGHSMKTDLLSRSIATVANSDCVADESQYTQVLQHFDSAAAEGNESAHFPQNLGPAIFNGDDLRLTTKECS